jgi:hypothetical protein
MSTTVSIRGRCAGSDPVHPALGGADGALDRCGLFALGLAGGGDLLGFFQPEQGSSGRPGAGFDMA